MAKFKFEAGPGTLCKTLTFMDTEFVNTWIPTDTGSRTLEKAFDTQVEQKFPETPDDVLEIIDEIDCMDEDELQEALEQLIAYEQERQS